MIEFIELLKENLITIFSNPSSIRFLIINLVIISLPLVHSILRFEMKMIHSLKILLKWRMVMKDKNENLYILIEDGKKIIKATYDDREQTITYSKLTDSSHFDSSTIASSAETLEFNFAYSSIKKPTGNITKKNGISKETDLIGKLLKKKVKDANLTYQTLAIAFCIEILLYFVHPSSSNMFVMVFICGMMFLVFLKQIILNYRVRKGLYGTCFNEAREILLFIKSEKKDKGSGTKISQLVFKNEQSDINILKELCKGERNVERN